MEVCIYVFGSLSFEVEVNFIETLAVSIFGGPSPRWLWGGAPMSVKKPKTGKKQDLTGNYFVIFFFRRSLIPAIAVSKSLSGHCLRSLV
jgi:hypothetical protein